MNIIARLTKDAEVRTTARDKQVLSFSVAINHSYRNKEGQRVEQPTFLDCSYWISMNIAKALKKGVLVELLGRVSARAWNGKDGAAKAALNFHVSQIKLHGSPVGRREVEKNDAFNPIDKSLSTGASASNTGEDDLPF